MIRFYATVYVVISSCPSAVLNHNGTPNYFNQINSGPVLALGTYVRPKPGARPTNDISVESEIRPKFAVLWFKMYSTDRNEILHTSRQLHCCDVCKISFVGHVLNSSPPNFDRDRISNSIEITLVGQAPGCLSSPMPPAARQEETTCGFNHAPAFYRARWLVKVTRHV